MPPPFVKPAAGLGRLVRALRHSIAGLRGAWSGEAAFREEAAVAAVLIPASFWVGRNWAEVALLAGSVVLLLIVELLNSSVEAAIDRISFDWHELSKRAKDLGSAAVLLASLLCAGVWLAALVPIVRGWLGR